MYVVPFVSQDLIPTLMAGVDAEAVCLGASEVLKNAIETDNVEEIPSVLN